MKQHVDFIINGRRYRIEHLNKVMNNQFLELHKAYFAGRGVNLNDFKEKSLKFFDDNVNNYSAHDEFFNNFTIIWQNFLVQSLFDQASELWNDALSIAYDWETKNVNNRIHKGTPYYFLGVTAILKKDIEKGFLLMHQALEEDKKTHKTSKPKTPAYFFATLDYSQQNQFFRNNVLDISRFMDQMLAEYRSTRNSALDLDEFRSEFLGNTDLQETVFYYVFTVYRLKKLIFETAPRLTQNVFSSLLMANIIFDLCLIIDKTIEHKNPSKRYLFDHIIFLSQSSSLSLNQDKLSQIRKSFDTNFNETLKSLLESKYKFQDGSSPQKIEEDLAIAYGFRNFGAHRIEDQPIIYTRFKDISQRISNSLFFSFEKLFLSTSSSAVSKSSSKKAVTTSKTTTTRSISKSLETFGTLDPRLVGNMGF